MREVVPLVERTGLDEGYLDFAGLAADFSRARAVAEAVQTSVSAATQPLVLARRRSDEGRGQGRLRPAQAGRDHRRPGGDRGRLPRALRRAGAPGRRSSRGGTAGRGRGDDGRGARGALRPRPARAAARPGRADAPRPGARASTRAGSRRRASGSRSRSRRPSSATCSTAGSCTPSSAGWRTSWASTSGATASLRAHGDRRSCGTRDFSIRSRSTSLDVGIDDPERIGELACALLDRGLRDRPGALRLVGVGLSGLSDFRQLSLDEPSQIFAALGLKTGSICR